MQLLKTFGQKPRGYQIATNSTEEAKHNNRQEKLLTSMTKWQQTNIRMFEGIMPIAQQ